MKRISVVFLVSMLLAGCAAAGGEKSAMPPAAAQQEPPGASYRIAPGDVLEITVYGERDLSKKGLVVRPDGKVTFPLAGDIKVGDMTTVQVKQELEKKLHAFIPEAVATVSVQTLGSLQYYVVGKVNKPGMFDVSRPLTVLQALALAGGLTVFADQRHIQIVRNQDGKVSRLPFNYKEVVNGKHLEQNIVLQRGDTVVVP